MLHQRKFVGYFQSIAWRSLVLSHGPTAKNCSKPVLQFFTIRRHAAWKNVRRDSTLRCVKTGSVVRPMLSIYLKRLSNELRLIIFLILSSHYFCLTMIRQLQSFRWSTCSIQIQNIRIWTTAIQTSMIDCLILETVSCIYYVYLTTTKVMTFRNFSLVQGNSRLYANPQVNASKCFKAYIHGFNTLQLIVYLLIFP